MLFKRYLRADRSRRTTTEQILKSRAHLRLWQMNPIAVSGQYPFKRIVEKFPDGLEQGPFSPNETGRSFQRLGMGIPPETEFSLRLRRVTVRLSVAPAGIAAPLEPVTAFAIVAVT